MTPGSGPILARRIEFVEEAIKYTASLAQDIKDTRQECTRQMQSMYDATQVVYGKAAVDVYADDDDQTPFAKQHDLMTLLYPMFKEGSDERVYMHAKRVDATTAQMSLVRVCVYDPHSDVPYQVGEFSAVPRP